MHIRKIKNSEQFKVVNLCSSIILFFVISALPFTKAYLFGEESSGLQQSYIIYFFILQFFSPISNFGLNWRNIRVALENDNDLVLSISGISLIICIVVFLVSVTFGAILLCAFGLSLYNYALQKFKINGQIKRYYFFRILKVILELQTLFIFLNYFPSTFLYFVLLEAFAISVICIWSVCFAFKKQITIVFNFKYLDVNFGYVVLKVIKSSVWRLSFPILYPQSGVEKIFFILLGYEMVSQFLSINFTKLLIEQKAAVRYLTAFVVISIPVQLGSIELIAYLYSWTLLMQEVTFIVLVGVTSLLNVGILALIKNNLFSGYIKSVVFLLGLKAIVLSILFFDQVPYLYSFYLVAFIPVIELMFIGFLYQRLAKSN